jgi:uncharacterized protein (TIGR03084 family)
VDEIVAALAAEQQELVALVRDLDADALLRPSRCAGWTVADVLLHLAQTDDMAVASVGGTFDDVVGRMAEAMVGREAGNVDEWAAVAVDVERTPPEDARDRYLIASAAELAAFDGVDLHARVPWVAGPMAARSLCTTRLSETWIHHGDIAEAFGALPAPTDRLAYIARLAWRTLPYAFTRAGREMHGPVTFELEAPDGTTWTFAPDEPAGTVVSGTAADLCAVAAQRAEAADTALTATGPDAAAVLDLVRTFA